MGGAIPKGSIASSSGGRVGVGSTSILGEESSVVGTVSDSLVGIAKEVRSKGRSGHGGG